MSKLMKQRSLPRSLGLGLASAMMFASIAVSGANSAETGNSAPGAVPAGAIPDLYERARVHYADGVVFLTDPHFPPSSFLDSNDKLTGYLSDILMALLEKIGVPAKIEYGKFEVKIPGVQSGRYDTGYADYTPERRAIVSFLNVIASGISLALPAGNPENLDMHTLCGYNVGTITGTVGQQKIMPELQAECSAAGKPAIVESMFPGANDAVIALRSGRVAGILNDTATVGYMVQQDPQTFAKAATSETQDRRSGLIFNVDNKELLGIFADAAKAIWEDGTYNKIVEKWNAPEIMLPHPFVNDDPVK